MKSYQNLKILQNLYKLQSIGFKYCDPFEFDTGAYEPIANNITDLHKQIQTCHLCDFSKGRTQSMPGWGNPKADVMFIDYTVSHIEDSTNNYFCGKSAQMLKNMIENVLKLDINDIFYTYAIKCKPLQIRQNYETQWHSCKRYLLSQIEFISPKIIVTLGSEAFEKLTGQVGEFEKLRGHMIEFGKTKIIPIYHPNYLLRNTNMKKIAFNDLKTIKTFL